MKKLSQYIKEQEMAILEMARIGYLDNALEVYINTNDPGHIPHFHVRDKATRGDNFHTCIEIKTNRYFHHTGKEDVLNSSQRKALMEFVKSKDKYGDEIWPLIIKEWNRNNSDFEVDLNQNIPDYTTIHENK